MKVKHVPMRTCIATGVKKPKKELLRIVQDPVSGDFVVDIKGKIRVRGANLDMNEAAFDIMVKKRALMRALKLNQDLTSGQYAKLKSDFLNAIEEKKFREGNKPVKIRISKEDLKKVQTS